MLRRVTNIAASACSLWIQSRFATIQTNPTPNPNCLRFWSPELSFLPTGKSLDVALKRDMFKSPFAKEIFDLGLEIVSVYIADEFVTVTKRKDVEWQNLIPKIQEKIDSYCASKKPLLSEAGEKEINFNFADTEPQLDDSEVVLAIKELICSRIRPMLTADGGNLRYVGYNIEDGQIFVMLEGACRNCPSAGETLKNGIERMIMHWIPEVTGVQEVDLEFAMDWQQQEEFRKEELKQLREESAAFEKNDNNKK